MRLRVFVFLFAVLPLLVGCIPLGVCCEDRFVNVPAAQLTGSAEPFRLTYTTDRAAPEIEGGSLHLTTKDFGVMLTGFSCEYVGQGGEPLSDVSIAKQNFDYSIYLPPPNGGLTLETTVNITQITASLTSDSLRPLLTSSNGSQIRSAKLVLYGQDDNFNQIAMPVEVPVYVVNAT
jgi:hypothetical protein